MKHLFLNPKVQAEVTANPELFLVFRMINGCYDSDIDPLHNPDMVAQFRANEEKVLEQAKRDLAKFKDELAGDTEVADWIKSR